MGHPLATRQGIALIFGLLAGSGSMCPECGHGTRVTSKRWARCKRCGQRVARRPVEEAIDTKECRDVARVVYAASAGSEFPKGGA